MTAFADRPLVYVAGPYTRPDPVLNTHRIIKVADHLQGTGLVTCHVPHLNHLWNLVAPHDDVEHWYSYDLAILRRCDALLRVEGESAGADTEVSFAEEHGIRVFFDQDHLLSWAFTTQTPMASLEPC